MNNTDHTASSSWERIQNGVRETERLLGQKRYNMAMVKARQTLEFMVKCLCDNNGITETGLVDMIDALYAEGFIKKTTCEHYHKIRTIGNKAIHEEHNSAYDANQAHHFLSQEVCTFANDYTDKRRKAPTRPASERAPAGANSGRGTSNRGSSSDRSGRPVNRSSRRRGSAPKRGFQLADIIKILIPLAIVLLLIVIIRMAAPGTDKKETTAEPTTITTTMKDSVPASTDIEPTSQEEPATTAVPVTSYKTTATLNVRSNPSTDSTILTQLAPDTAIEVVRDHDEKWAVITYNGEEAYVSKEYIKEVTE